MSLEMEKDAIVTDFSIHSIIVIMDSLERLETLKNFPSKPPSLQGLTHLHIYYTTIKDELKAVEISENQNLSMDNAIQYSAVQPHWQWQQMRKQ